MQLTKPKRRVSFATHSGLTHARYGHAQRPTLIEVRCPKCSARALATDDAHKSGRLIVGDLSPDWNSGFSVCCVSCAYRAEAVGYFELPERFHQISIQGKTLWAWNRDHLLMIQKVLQGARTDGDPYAFLATYIHRDWKRGRSRFSRAIDRWLRMLAS